MVVGADSAVEVVPAEDGAGLTARRLSWLAREVARMVYREARVTAWGLWLALMIAPLSLSVEMLLPIALTELAGDKMGGALSSSCRGLKNDFGGLAMVAVSSSGTVIGLGGGLLAMLERDRRKLAPFLPHFFLMGTAAAVIGIASVATSASNAWQAVRDGLIIDYMICALPYASYSAWSYVLATRKVLRRAALTLVFGMFMGIACTLMGCLSFFYIVLSDKTSGFAGFAVNGLCYPILLVLGRRRILSMVGSRGAGSAAVMCLCLKMLTSIPQFYVLTVCVKARWSTVISSHPFGSTNPRVLHGACLGTENTHRIDEPVRFATSALSNVVTEVVEAVFIARDATSIFASAWTGLTHKINAFGSRAQSATSGEGPCVGTPSNDGSASWSARIGSGVQGEPSHNLTAVVPNAPAPVSLFETPPSAQKAHTSHSSPVSPSARASEHETRVERFKNELAARLAHDDFGEKCALVLACSIGVLLQDSRSSAWVNAAILAILEGVADEIKHHIYASHGILVQRATFKHRWVTWLGVALVGTGSCLLLSAGIRLNCLLGDSIADG
jgi:hypothetical protein